MQRGTQKFKAPLLVLLYTHLFLGFFYPKTRPLPNLSRKPYTEYFSVLSIGIKTVMQPALNVMLESVHSPFFVYLLPSFIQAIIVKSANDHYFISV